MCVCWLPVTAVAQPLLLELELLDESLSCPEVSLVEGEAHEDDGEHGKEDDDGGDLESADLSAQIQQALLLRAEVRMTEEFFSRI